jgi:hypothetical protein
VGELPLLDIPVRISISGSPLQVRHFIGVA